jgi:hypothetical protein
VTFRRQVLQIHGILHSDVDLSVRLAQLQPLGRESIAYMDRGKMTHFDFNFFTFDLLKTGTVIGV